jgi:hypothetical protein
MNAKGIKFVHEHTQPLAVNTMDAAAEVIRNNIAKKIAEGKDTKFAVDSPEFARHLAWVIGFDALVDDRKAVHEFTTKIV